MIGMRELDRRVVRAFGRRYLMMVVAVRVSRGMVVGVRMRVSGSMPAAIRMQVPVPVFVRVAHAVRMRFPVLVRRSDGDRQNEAEERGPHDEVGEPNGSSKRSQRTRMGGSGVHGDSISQRYPKS